MQMMFSVRCLSQLQTYICIYWFLGLLQEFFLRALGFRYDNPSVERSLADSIENSTCVALVRLALKLPEASLRPLLFKIFTWGTDNDKVTCLLPLFTLYGHLAAALKSMFPIFTGSLSSYLVKILVSFIISPYICKKF